MSAQMGYDEDKAIEFIRKTLPETVNMQYSDDEILYVIDIIWEWYEKNGYLSLDSEVTEEEDLDISKLTAYVKKQLNNDGEILMDPADLELIVRGEIEYEESIDDVV